MATFYLGIIPYMLSDGVFSAHKKVKNKKIACFVMKDYQHTLQLQTY